MHCSQTLYAILQLFNISRFVWINLYLPCANKLFPAPSTAINLLLDVNAFHLQWWKITLLSYLLNVFNLIICDMFFCEQMPEIDSYYDDDRLYERTCPNTNHVFDSNYAKSFRDPLKNMVDSSCPASQAR